MIISPLKTTRENFTPLGKIGGMKYIMSKKALGKLALIEGAVDGKCTVKEAAGRFKSKRTAR